jgi:2-hydroxy-6-oxonona-2,4-dienedioate hydrolase
MQLEGCIATHRTGQAIASTSILPLLPHITAPALVIHGVQDNTVPVADAWLFRQHIPASEIILLEECGHFPMYEKFPDYIRVLRMFLSASA